MRTCTLLFFFLLGLLTALPGRAQVDPSKRLPTICPTQPTAKQRQEALALRSTYAQFVRGRRVAAGPATPKFIPLRIHIVRNSDGTGGVSMTEVVNGLANTNKLFNASGIQFYLATEGAPGDPNYWAHYINDDRFVTFRPDQEVSSGPGQGKPQEFVLVDTTQATYARNAINVYFTKNILFFGDYPVGGYANFPGPNLRDNFLFVIDSQANDDVTLPHELGHYFNLYHTFQDNQDPDISKRELVTRSKDEVSPRLPANCDVAGDQVCDTPADPYGIRNVFPDFNCQYRFFGQAPVDANGDPFNPANVMSNIMSYWYFHCLNNLTDQQNERMRMALLPRTDPNNQYTLDRSATSFSPAELPNNLTASFTGTRVLLRWNDRTDKEAGYIVERSTSVNGPFIEVGGVGPDIISFSDLNLSPNQTYYYRLKPANSIDGHSEVLSTTSGELYCTPVFLSSNLPEDDRSIQRFSLAGENNQVMDNPSNGNSERSFGEFTTQQTGPGATLPVVTLQAGKPYSFSLTVRSYAAKFPDFFSDPEFAIWLDLNGDRTFSENERLANGTFAKDRLSLVGTLTIPQTLTPGLTRLRVRFSDGGGPVAPCIFNTHHETEDYLVDLQAAPDGPQPLALLDPIFNCQTGEFVFRTSGGNGKPIEFMGIGITPWTTNPNQRLDDALVRETGPVIITLRARQDGVEVTRTFHRQAVCGQVTPVANRAPFVNRVPNTQVANAEVYFSYVVPVETFGDPDGDALTYNATGLPQGLVFSPNTRSFVGTIPTAGSYTIQLTATDPGGLSATTSFLLNVFVRGSQEPLVLLEPGFNCQTGDFVFRTSGGNGKPIEFFGIGITPWTTNPNQRLDGPLMVETGPVIITLRARQDGVEVTRTFPRQAVCGEVTSGTNRPPFVNLPIGTLFLAKNDDFQLLLESVHFQDPDGDKLSYTVSNLPVGVKFGSSQGDYYFYGKPTQLGTYQVLITAYDPKGLSASMTFDFVVYDPSEDLPLYLDDPIFDCKTGEFIFRAGGGDGTPIEFFGIGITPWTTNPNQRLDGPLMVEKGPVIIVLRARQSGKEVTLTWQRQVACNEPVFNTGRKAAKGPEPVAGLQVKVLGNPVRDNRLTVEVRGAYGEPLHFTLTDLQGRNVANRRVARPATVERQTFLLSDQPAGTLLLNVTAGDRTRTVKVVKE